MQKPLWTTAGAFLLLIVAVMIVDAHPIVAALFGLGGFLGCCRAAIEFTALAVDESEE